MRRGSEIRKTLAEKFDDELRFFKGWIDKPKAVGSIVPTSSVTARRMASVIDSTRAFRFSRSDPAPVSSPAPSSPAVSGRKTSTQSNIPPISSAICGATIAGVNVIEGDAFDLDNTLGEIRNMMFDSVVSGVPLLNFPVAQRIAYLNELARPHP